MSVQAENSRSCSFLSTRSLGYNGSPVIWTVVRLTATKFKPSNSCSLYSLGRTQKKTVFQQFSIAVSRVCCRGNVFIGGYLPMAVSSCFTILVSAHMTQEFSDIFILIREWGINHEKDMLTCFYPVTFRFIFVYYSCYCTLYSSTDMTVAVYGRKIMFSSSFIKIVTDHKQVFVLFRTE
jgi:hypothetical protein